MNNQNLGITLPINLIPPDNFPKSVAVGDDKIVFLSGNLIYINFVNCDKKSRWMEVSLINDESFCLKEEQEMINFVSQFPEEILKKAENLYRFYLAYC